MSGIEAAGDIVAVGNDLVSPLNEFNRAMNDCNAATARDVRLSQVLVSASNAGPALDDLATRDSSEGYIAVHEAGRVWVENLATISSADEDWLALLDDVEESLDATECLDLRRTDEWNDAVDAHNESVAEANSSLGDVQDARDALLDQVPDLASG